MLILCLISIVYAQEAIHYDQQWEDQCIDGTEQSPIDVPQKNCKCDSNMHFSIDFVDEDMEVLMKKKEYTIQTRAPISKLYATSPDGTLYGYTATRFNFRSPSEHTIDGHHFDMELQLYHRISKEFTEIVQKQLTIVSVFFEVSDTLSQPFFDAYDFSLLDQDDPTIANISLIINPQQLLGQQLDLTEFYNYEGSQTLFPCKEEVNWYILNQVLPISQQQLDNFNHFFKYNDSFAEGKGNNRDTQSLNERVIRKQGATCQGHFLQDLMMFSMYVVVIGIIYKFI